MLRRRVIGRRLVRTAAVGGVAYAAGHHMATKSAQQSQTDAQQNAQIDDLQQQQPAPPPPVYQQPTPVYQQPTPVYQQPAPPPSGGLTDDKIEQLKQLGALRDSGVLTDAEFEVAKQKILSSF
jgi:Short C-terminal domain